MSKERTLWLADGLHRLQEAKLNGLKVVDVVFKEDGKVKLAKVDPQTIKVPDVRVTSVWTEEEYKVFQDTIKASGIENPIVCTTDIVEAMTKNLFMNRLKGKTKLSEEVGLLRELSEKFKLSIEEIQKRTGLKADQIEQRLAIGNASSLVQQAVETEPIGLGVAFQLSRLPNEKGQGKLLMELMKMIPPPTTSYVKEIVDESLRVLAERAKGQTAANPTIPVKTLKCHICEQPYEYTELRGIFVCATCYGVAKDYVLQRIREQTAKVSPERALAERVAIPEEEGEGVS